MINATLISKWGFDGATDQSIYKQKFTDMPDDFIESGIMFIIR